ncbi:LysM peptidoglycan-binding domain-containing protein [Nocardioides sp. JQ2195]|uniref:LysM peptidoglycan-binding domain-containing protein n=1 Tax=Nocardioides sp. JQ2195 TaxID=2592334 RepID=UPI00143E2CA8|nr:LysM peptidoglycan-binding domain-containing protein [Nocardioides sp. JQ2195]QIX27969.1 LysM peptidoglycan-binding domain-containing protein [Nocardioides sp. JQ2195]
MSTMTLSPASQTSTIPVGQRQVSTIQVGQRQTSQGKVGQRQLRLTRRGRVVIFIAALLVVMGAALLLANASTATNHAGVDQPTRAVVVESGDTLWSIAGDLAGDGEVRDMVHEIKQLNALDSSMLMTGQTIFVPIS